MFTQSYLCCLCIVLYVRFYMFYCCFKIVTQLNSPISLFIEELLYQQKWNSRYCRLSGQFSYTRQFFIQISDLMQVDPNEGSYQSCSKLIRPNIYFAQNLSFQVTKSAIILTKTAFYPLRIFFYHKNSFLHFLRFTFHLEEKTASNVNKKISVRVLIQAKI